LLSNLSHNNKLPRLTENRGRRSLHSPLSLFTFLRAGEDYYSLFFKRKVNGERDFLKVMSNLLKDFEVASKNPSLEARQRWRSSVGLVKNRARRFRMISNLDKLAENEKKRCQIQVCCFLLPSLFSVSVNLLISTTVFDIRSRSFDLGTFLPLMNPCVCLLLLISFMFLLLLMYSQPNAK